MADALVPKRASAPASRVDHLSDADALASLNSVPQGLSSAEARRRLLEFGPNHVE